MRTLTLIVLLSIKSALHLEGQTFNIRLTLDSGAVQVGRGVEQNEQGFLFFSTWRMDSSSYRIGIVQTNMLGDKLDEKVYIVDSAFTYVGNHNTSDRIPGIGFISAGSYEITDSESRAYILCYDDSGDTLWTSEIANDLDFYIGYQVKTITNGYAICGTTSEGSASSDQMFLAKFDMDGILLWKEIYFGNNASASAVGLIETPDGGFLLGGANMENDNWDQMLVKTDSEGNQQWKKYYGGEFSDHYAIVENSNDGNFVFGGQLANNSSFGSKAWVYKVDPSGEEIWSHEYGEDGNGQYVNTIKLLPNGDYLVLGVDHAIGEDVMGFLLRIDTDGNEKWYRRFAQTEGNWCYLTDVIVDTEGYFVCTGDLFPDLDLTQDIWGFRVDSCGCLIPGCGGLNCNTIDIDEKTNSSDLGFILGPNPADRSLNVFLQDVSYNLDNCEFVLYNLFGQEILSFVTKYADTSYMTDVSGLASGSYILAMRVNYHIVHSEVVEILHN